MEKVKWGIIGVGDVTEIKSGPAFNKIKNSEIAAVMRRTTSKAKDYAERHNIPKWYDDTDKLINDPDVNAIYIATPPSSHLEYTIKAAKAKKPVYVEKPMAINHQQCLEMIEACDKNNVPLFAAYYRRCLPLFLRVKELIENDTLGKVQFVKIKLLWKPRAEDYNKANLPWRVKKDISGGGYFIDLASHQFDYLDYVFGPVKSIIGKTNNFGNLYEVEDYVSALFEFENGIEGSGVWSFNVDKNSEKEEIEIYGTKGSIAFSTFEQAPIKVTVENETYKIVETFPEHVQQPLIQTIVNELTWKGKCPSTGITGARANWVIDQIYKA